MCGLFAAINGVAQWAPLVGESHHPSNVFSTVERKKETEERPNPCPLSPLRESSSFFYSVGHSTSKCGCGRNNVPFHFSRYRLATFRCSLNGEPE